MHQAAHDVIADDVTRGVTDKCIPDPGGHVPQGRGWAALEAKGNYLARQAGERLADI